MKLYLKDIKAREPSENYLYQERIYDFEHDVDMIYDIFFKKFVDDVNNYKTIDFDNYKVNTTSFEELLAPFKRGYVEYVLFGGLKSNQLKSYLCVKADRKLPITLFFGISEKGCLYNFNNINALGITYIWVSVNSSLAFKLRNKTKSEFLYLGKPAIVKRALNEITEIRIKASIVHELTHWIDNSEYNVLDNIMNNAKTPEEKQRALLLKKKNVNMTYFEIQSQIHAIAQIKKSLGDKYEEMSLQELFNMYTSLHRIFFDLNKNYGEEVSNEWLKFLIKRMAREGILGKNMRTFDKNAILENSIKIENFKSSSV